MNTKTFRTVMVGALTAAALMVGMPRESLAEEKQEETQEVSENCCTPKKIEGGYECVEVDGERECLLTGYNWTVNGQCVVENCIGGGCQTPYCDFANGLYDWNFCNYTGDVMTDDGEIVTGDYYCFIRDMTGDEFVELCSRRGGEVLLDLLGKNPFTPTCQLKPGVHITCIDYDGDKPGLSDHQLTDCMIIDYTKDRSYPVEDQSEKVFFPKYLGYRIDWCATWGTGCGEPAADQFCRSRFGMTSSAIDFRQQADVGATEPTYVLGDGKVCNSSYCDAFWWIECDLNTTAKAPSEYIAIDVEDGNLRWPMRVASSATASGNEYAWVPDGAGTGGYIHLPFSVSRDGEYVVWGREASNSKSDDSFYVQLIGGSSSQMAAQALWDTRRGGGTDSWVWDRVSDRGVADPVLYSLKAGTSYGLVIRQRESGTKIDRVIITNDLDFVPFDYLVEAEWGDLTRPMRREPPFCTSWPCVGDEEASNREYILTPNGAGTNGSARYTFTVPAPGMFRVLGRVKAPNGHDDSFFVSLDDSPPVLWDTGRHGWMWVNVRDRYLNPRDVLYALDQREHTLTIAQREDGTMLDQLLITNDPTFRAPEPMNECLTCTGGH